jgi:hypothetical protein
MFMRFAKVAIVIAILLAGGAADTRADAPSAAFLKRVDELVRWISEHSSYPAALKQRPKFVFLAPETIRHRFSNTSMGYAEKNDVRAAQTNETIFLPDTFVLGQDDYMLVHELVHFLQDETDRKFSCLAEREREAYRLQTAFVNEIGVGSTPNDMFKLMLRFDIRE